MARLACRIVSRAPGGFPCLVVDPDGWRLRLSVTPPRLGLAPAGRVDGVPVWAEEVEDDGTAPGEELVLLEEEDALDEVGVRAGPDDDSAGIFDLPGRDRTGTGERTGHHSDEAAIDQQRTAVLAWVAAALGPLPAVPDTGPCGPLKRKIADAPLDPVPALDGVGLTPPRRIADSVLRVELGREDTAPTAPGLLEDPATNTRVVTRSEIGVASEVPRWPLVAAAALVILAALVWWWPR